MNNILHCSTFIVTEQNSLTLPTEKKKLPPVEVRYVYFRRKNIILPSHQSCLWVIPSFCLMDNSVNLLSL